MQLRTLLSRAPIGASRKCGSAEELRRAACDATRDAAGDTWQRFTVTPRSARLVTAGRPCAGPFGVDLERARELNGTFEPIVDASQRR